MEIKFIAAVLKSIKEIVIFFLNQKKIFDLKKKIIWEKPAYWIVDGNNQSGPFCQKCYDSNTKLIRLQGRNNDVWLCMNCKSRFYGPMYKPPKPIVIRSKWMDRFLN